MQNWDVVFYHKCSPGYVWLVPSSWERWSWCSRCWLFLAATGSTIASRVIAFGSLIVARVAAITGCGNSSLPLPRDTTIFLLSSVCATRGHYEVVVQGVDCVPSLFNVLSLAFARAFTIIAPRTSIARSRLLAATQVVCGLNLFQELSESQTSRITGPAFLVSKTDY